MDINKIAEALKQAPKPGNKTIFAGQLAFKKIMEHLGIIYGCSEIKHGELIIKLDKLCGDNDIISTDPQIVEAMKEWEAENIVESTIKISVSNGCHPYYALRELLQFRNLSARQNEKLFHDCKLILKSKSEELPWAL